MIALDTNVFARFLVDTPDGETDQMRRARALVAGAEKAGVRVHLTTTALVETVWVLERAYRIPRSEIVVGYERVLAAPLFDVASRQQVIDALSRYKDGPGDFADYLIEAQAIAAGAETVYTFDGGLLKGAPFAAPPPTSGSEPVPSSPG